MSSKLSWPLLPRNSPISGGFFDVASLKKRLGELDGLMAAQTFWNNREQAQKLIDEATSLRRRIEPLLEAEKKLEDLQVMVELCEAEPVSDQARHLRELETDCA